MKIYVISNSWDGLTPDIRVFYSEAKALKFLGEEVYDHNAPKPDPRESLAVNVADYWKWVREHNDNCAENLFTYSIFESDTEIIKIDEYS